MRAPHTSRLPATPLQRRSTGAVSTLALDLLDFASVYSQKYPHRRGPNSHLTPPYNEPTVTQGKKLWRWHPNWSLSTEPTQRFSLDNRDAATVYTCMIRRTIRAFLCLRHVPHANPNHRSDTGGTDTENKPIVGPPPLPPTVHNTPLKPKKKSLARSYNPPIQKSHRHCLSHACDQPISPSEAGSSHEIKDPAPLAANNKAAEWRGELEPSFPRKSCRRAAYVHCTAVAPVMLGRHACMKVPITYIRVDATCTPKMLGQKKKESYVSRPGKHSAGVFFPACLLVACAESMASFETDMKVWRQICGDLIGRLTTAIQKASRGAESAERLLSEGQQSTRESDAVLASWRSREGRHHPQQHARMGVKHGGFVWCMCGLEL